MDLREQVKVKIRSLYLLDEKARQELIDLIKDLPEDRLAHIDKKLDIILAKLGNLTNRLTDDLANELSHLDN